MSRQTVCWLYALLVLGLCCTNFYVSPGASSTGRMMLADSDDGDGVGDPRIVRIPPRINASLRPVYGDAALPFSNLWPRSSDCQRSADYCSSSRYVPLGSISNVPRTIGYWEHDYGIVNDWGVSMAESTTSARIAAVPYPKGSAILCMGQLSQLTLERARSAREAVQIAGELAETYGFYGDASPSTAGESLIIADNGYAARLARAVREEGVAAVAQSLKRGAAAAAAAAAAATTAGSGGGTPSRSARVSPHPGAAHHPEGEVGASGVVEESVVEELLQEEESGSVGFLPQPLFPVPSSGGVERGAVDPRARLSRSQRRREGLESGRRRVVGDDRGASATHVNGGAVGEAREARGAHSSESLRAAVEGASGAVDAARHRRHAARKGVGGMGQAGGGAAGDEGVGAAGGFLYGTKGSTGAVGGMGGETAVEQEALAAAEAAANDASAAAALAPRFGPADPVGGAATWRGGVEGMERGLAALAETADIVDSDVRGEGWIFHVSAASVKDGGAVWAAIRIPDGHIAAVANAFTIRTAEWDNRTSARLGASTLEIAKQLGLYEDGKMLTRGYEVAYASANGAEVGREEGGVSAAVLQDPHAAAGAAATAAPSVGDSGVVNFDTTAGRGRTATTSSAHWGDGRAVDALAAKTRRGGGDDSKGGVVDDSQRLRASLTAAAGVFDFSACFSYGEYASKYYTGRRMWRAYTLLGGSAGAPLSPFYDDYLLDAPYPATLRMAPGEKVELRGIMRLYRDAYGHTPFDLGTVAAGAGRSGFPLPFDVDVPVTTSGGRTVTGAWERPVAMLRTQLAIVVSSAAPVDVTRTPAPSTVATGAGEYVSAQPIVVWMCPHTPYGGSYTPLRVTASSPPPPIRDVDVAVYDLSSLFWVHRTITNLLLGLHSTAFGLVKSAQHSVEEVSEVVADAWQRAAAQPYVPHPNSESAHLERHAHAVRLAGRRRRAGQRDEGSGEEEVGVAELRFSAKQVDERAQIGLSAWQRLLGLVMLTASDGYIQTFDPVGGGVEWLEATLQRHHHRGGGRSVGSKHVRASARTEPKHGIAFQALNESGTSVGYPPEYLADTWTFQRGRVITTAPEVGGDD